MDLKIRDVGIDWLKACAIILVVLGHAIQYSLGPDFDSNILFHLIYSFHMPLFIFVSGYLVSSGKRIGFLGKQFKLLMIPFLIWMVLYSFYYRRFDLQIGHWSLLPSHYLDVFKSPGRGGLWFLWALYIIDVVYFFLRKSRYFYLLSVVLLIAIHVLTYWYPPLGYYGMGYFKFYYPFFLVGCLLRQYQFAGKITNWGWIALVVLMVVLQFTWTRTGPVHTLGLPVPEASDSWYALLVRQLTPVPVLLLLFKVSRYFKRTNRIVQWLSSNTLSVYASHFVWIYLLTNLLSDTVLAQSSLEIAFVFVVTGVATWVMIEAVNRIPVIRKLLFGR